MDSAEIGDNYSLTKTQKVRGPIGWPLMSSCDRQKGVGRHLATWRLSDQACGPQARCSLTGGKELRCPASGKRWQGQNGYEIEGARDGTSPQVRQRRCHVGRERKLLLSYSWTFHPGFLFHLTFAMFSTSFFFFIRLTIFLSFNGNF
jgi:hypothetical protein